MLNQINNPNITNLLIQYYTDIVQFTTLHNLNNVNPVTQDIRDQSAQLDQQFRNVLTNLGISYSVYTPDTYDPTHQIPRIPGRADMNFSNGQPGIFRPNLTEWGVSVRLLINMPDFRNELLAEHSWIATNAVMETLFVNMIEYIINNNKLILPSDIPDNHGVFTRTSHNLGVMNPDTHAVMWGSTGPSIWGHTLRAHNEPYITSPDRNVVDRQLTNVSTLIDFIPRNNQTTNIHITRSVALMLNINANNYSPQNRSHDIQLMNNFKQMVQLRLEHLHLGQDLRMQRYITGYDAINGLVTPNYDVFGLPVAIQQPITMVNINTTYMVRADGLGYRNDITAPDKVIHFNIQDFLDATTMVLNRMCTMANANEVDGMTYLPENIRNLINFGSPLSVTLIGTYASFLRKRNNQIKDPEIVLAQPIFFKPNRHVLMFEPVRSITEHAQTPGNIPYVIYSGGSLKLTRQMNDMEPFNTKPQNTEITIKTTQIKTLIKNETIINATLSHFIYAYVLGMRVENKLKSNLPKKIKNFTKIGGRKGKRLRRTFTKRGRKKNNKR